MALAERVVDAVFAQAIIEGARGSGIEPLFDMGA